MGSDRDDDTGVARPDQCRIPFLPGHCIDVSPGYEFPHTTRFDLVQGQAICDPLQSKRRLPPSQTNVMVHEAAETGSGRRTQADLHRRLHNTDVTMSKVPAWIALDQHVLRFTGYYSQSVHDSQTETYRHIEIVLLYYLQDGTIRITETKEDNNGLRHGDLLARARIPLADTDLDGPGQYVGPEHLRTGLDVAIFGRVYHLVDADQYTRRFYADRLGPAEPIPIDPFHQRQLDQAGPGRAGQHSHDPVSAHYESVHGRPQPWQLERSRQFLALDRKVLRFFGRWQDRDLVLHFFLADDTVEVLEIAQPNSGRDPVPALVKRQRLRKATPSFGIDQIGQNTDHQADCYGAHDLHIGRVIHVFGREVVLERADPFTRDYYRAEFGVELAPDILPSRPGLRSSSSAAAGPGRIVSEDSAAAHHHYGGDDDIIEQDAIEAAQIALKGRAHRPDRHHRRLAKQAMRFKARQVSNRPEDVARQFVVTFFLADETVSVFENPIRNSGFIAGKFLERSLTYNRDQKRMFKKEDFQIGACVQIHGFIFELLDADTCTRQMLDPAGSSSAWSTAVGDSGRCRTDLREIRSGLRALLNNKNTALRKTFRIFDNDKDGFLSRSEFDNLLYMNGWDLDPDQMQIIFNEFDRDRDGNISFDEFTLEVEGPAH